MRLINYNSSILINLKEAKWNSRSISIVRKVVKVSKLKKNSMSIVLSNDKHLKSLNYKWKGKNYPTNVLSFPNINNENIETAKNNYLGDIYLAFETLKKEANLGKVIFINHLSHLLIHGILHLKGYKHDNKSNQKVMQSEEIRILKLLNIINPYRCNRGV